MMKVIYLRITLIKQINIFFACAIVWASIPTATANADYNLVVSSQTGVDGLNNPTILCKHQTGTSEGADNSDRFYLDPLTDKKIHFYSWNPLTMPITDGRLKVDARPIDSMSTYTCYFAGENLDSGEVVNDNLSFGNYNTSDPSNVIAFFYNNSKDPNDPTFTSEPNWVYSGVTLDAQEAGKNPGVSPVSVLVRNGLSNVMQVKFFKPSDVNFSGKTDLEDFSIVSSQFGKIINPRTAYSPVDDPNNYADVNRNGSVGLEDVAIVAEDWLFQKPAYEIDQYNPDIPIS